MEPAITQGEVLSKRREGYTTKRYLSEISTLLTKFYGSFFRIDVQVHLESQNRDTNTDCVCSSLHLIEAEYLVA